MAAKISNQLIVITDTKRIAALEKYVTQSKTEIPVGGQILHPADLVKLFQASLDTQAAVTAARAKYKAALAERDAVEKQRRIADDALKAWVLNRFGANGVEAHEFGYSPRKLPQMSAEDRANAVKKNLATRRLRGTMGNRHTGEASVTPMATSAPLASDASHATTPSANVAA